MSAAHPSGMDRCGREHVRTISTELLRQELQSHIRLFMVDVRPRHEFHGALGHIAGALSIPMHELLGRWKELATHRGELVVVISQTGDASRLAGLELEFAGFEDVRSLEGGMQRWAELGYAVER